LPDRLAADLRGPPRAGPAAAGNPRKQNATRSSTPTKGLIVLSRVLPDLSPKHAETDQQLARRRLLQHVPFHRGDDAFMAKPATGQNFQNGNRAFRNIPNLKRKFFPTLPFKRRASSAMARRGDSGRYRKLAFFLHVRPTAPALKRPVNTVIGEWWSGMDRGRQAQKRRPPARAAARSTEPDKMVKVASRIRHHEPAVALLASVVAYAAALRSGLFACAGTANRVAGQSIKDIFANC